MTALNLNTMIKLQLTIFVILLCICDITAQTTTLPKLKYTQTNTLSRIIENGKQINGFTLAYGYHQTTFLNEVFGMNISNNVISRKYGGVLMARMKLYPIIIDVDWFSSRFRISDAVSWPYSDTTNVRHRGMGFFISSALFPLMHSKIFVPYVGIGYQTSSLGVGVDIIEMNDSNKSIEPSSIITSCPQWKAGFLVNMSRMYNLTIEYRQSFPLNREMAFNEISIILGLNFSN